MKNPIIPMTAVTGKPGMEEITDYLKSIKNFGIDQIMIYPRSGCEIEYLSEAWFETVYNFILAAQQLEMNIWLYDDFNWPSGDAGGKVSKISEYWLSRKRVIRTRLKRYNFGIFRFVIFARRQPCCIFRTKIYSKFYSFQVTEF